MFIKPPDSENRDYQFDWTDELGGLPIDSSSFTVSPVGLTITDGGIAGSFTKVLTTDGTLGTKYTITNEITFTRDSVTVTEVKELKIFIEPL